MALLILHHVTVKHNMTNCNADNVQGQQGSAPRERRARRLIHVDIERKNNSGFPAIVTNLSMQGMGGHTEGFLEPFELITIIKKGYGRIFGEVRWTDGPNFGVLFAEPVNVDLFTFTDDKQKHIIQRPSDDDIWRGFESISSTRSPGVTGGFSQN